ncbi:MFS transporter [Lentzea atacamensis]|uniref:MFS transporter n=1 Tax=Lentzea atacamensis TaxID=531938 RepID=A0ABX9DY20_9PSEU|nr:MFS transporter [Lentzea atacamensis]RAS59448.1 MFS transporter [Lentzea atacamensis]
MTIHAAAGTSAPPKPTTARYAPVLPLLALTACTALGGLSSSSITAAVPVLSDDMASPWLVPSYFLGAGLTAVTGGRIADLLGPRRVAAAGLAIIMLTCVAAAAATTGTALAATRLVLGAATAALFPAAVVLVRRLRPSGPAQVAGLAAISLATEVAFAAGPSLGSVLVGLGGWQMVVLAPIPLAALAGILIVTVLPPDPAPVRRRSLLRRLDPLGLVLLGAVAGAILASLQDPGAHGLIIGLAAAVAASVLVTWERRARYALFPPSVMTRRLSAVYLRTGAYYGGLYALTLIIPVWLVGERELTAGQAAGVMAGLPVTTVLCCLATPALIARHGLRPPLVTGAAALAAAAAILATAGEQTPLLVLAAAVALCGVPAGLVNIAQQTALLRAAPASATGACSGLYGVVQLVTGSVVALIQALGTAAVVALACCAALMVLTVADRSLRTEPGPTS